MASAFVFCALLYLASASGTTAQGIAERQAEASAPPPLGLAPPNLDGSGGKISGFDAAAYRFKFALPNATTTAAVPNTSPVHLPSGIRSNLFSIRPCSYATVPHYHANAAEYFFAVRGKTRVFVYVNGKIIEHTVEAGANSYSTHIAPKGQLHWYFNDECERSVMLAVLNPPEGVPSAFAGYFTPLPRAFTDGRMTAADVRKLIKTGTVKPTGSGPTAFDLTNSCLKKCRKHSRGQSYKGRKTPTKKGSGKGKH